MQVWQHLDNMDHLRRRAEGMINASRGPQKGSAAANGHTSTSTQDAQRHSIKEAIQDTPGLLDFNFDTSN